MIGLPGTQELLIIAFVCLLLFGGNKLPELLGGLGQGISAFKKGLIAPPDQDDND